MYHFILFYPTNSQLFNIRRKILSVCRKTGNDNKHKHKRKPKRKRKHRHKHTHKHKRKHKRPLFLQNRQTLKYFRLHKLVFHILGYRFQMKFTLKLIVDLNRTKVVNKVQ